MLLSLLLALDLHGWADVYYARNSNDARENFLPGTGTSGHRGGELDLDAAALDLSLDPKPVGLHLTLAFGSGMEVLHAAEAAPFANVYQASVSWAAGPVAIEAGVYPSHIGYESFFSKDNWSYTRGWMGEYSPYYQAGMKATYALGESWSVQVHALDGWQIIRGGSGAAGTQIAYSGESLSMSFNTFAGPSGGVWRLFGDWVAQWKASSWLSFGATADLGWQRPALWHAAGVYARVALQEKVGLALRAEYYDDRDGLMTGAPRTLHEATATLEFRPEEHLILKLEGRADDGQSMGVASAVAAF